MGHERVGALPRTKRWQDVVGGISDAASVDGDVRELANATLENVRSRLLAIPRRHRICCVLPVPARPCTISFSRGSIGLPLVNLPSTWRPTLRHSNLRAPSASMLQTTGSQPNMRK